MVKLNWQAFTSLTVAQGPRWAVFAILGGGLAFGGILGALVVVAFVPTSGQGFLPVLVLTVTVAVCGAAILTFGMWTRRWRAEGRAKIT